MDLQRRKRKIKKEIKELIYADAEINTAYFLFKYKDWKPTDYYNCKPGERLIIQSFIEKHVEEEKEQLEREKEAYGEM
ncbi:hypothetical protein C1146_00155 [Clostridium botulinum]|nr:hypothetical protein C1146_00155 [Clostridium botulinum]